jgi:hypothetical protein
MSLKRRLHRLEKTSDPEQPELLKVFIRPEKEPDPPHQFRTEEAAREWLNGQDLPENTVVILFMAIPAHVKEQERQQGYYPDR